MWPPLSWGPATSTLGPLTLGFWSSSSSSLAGQCPGQAQGTGSCGFAMTTSGTAGPPPSLPRNPSAPAWLPHPRWGVGPIPSDWRVGLPCSPPPSFLHGASETPSPLRLPQTPALLSPLGCHSSLASECWRPPGSLQLSSLLRGFFQARLLVPSVGWRPHTSLSPAPAPGCLQSPPVQRV